MSKNSEDRRYNSGGFVHNAPHLAGELFEKWGPVAPIERKEAIIDKGGESAKMDKLRSTIFGGK